MYCAKSAYLAKSAVWRRGRSCGRIHHGMSATIGEFDEVSGSKATGPGIAPLTRSQELGERRMEPFGTSAIPVFCSRSGA